MKIDLRLHASLGKYMPDPDMEKGSLSCPMEVPEGTTIGELIERIGIPKDSIKIMFLNGIHAQDKDLLKTGDRLAIFPPIAGG